MNRSIARAVIATLLAAGVAQTQLVSAAGPAYQVRYLPGLGGNNSRGNSINDDGLVSGYSHVAGNQYRHATMWLGDSPTDLGVLGSKNRQKNSNVAWPVKNTLGLIVGISQTDAPDPYGENWSCSAFFVPATSTGSRCLGFAWQNGKMRPLPTLGGTHGYAAAANNSGLIVGWAENTVLDSSCTPPQLFQFRAVVWGPNGAGIQELPVLPLTTSSAATAINDKGQIVGISGACDQAIGAGTAAHSVLWNGGNVTEIPNLGGAQWNTPTAINQRGDVAGFGDLPGDVITEAFLWTPEGGLSALGFLYPDHTLSEAFGINESRQIVGLSCNDAECRAFLWQEGVMYDLNVLAGIPAGELLTHGMDINDAGVITGRATKIATGERVTYVATPTGAALARVAARDGDSNAAVRVSLPADVLKEALHPLGPGLDRLRGAR
jgi:probable HAF family extracellular repeat protein